MFSMTKSSFFSKYTVKLADKDRPKESVQLPIWAGAAYIHIQIT